MIYTLVTGFLRLVTMIFFRQIEVSGHHHIPPDQPVIFVGNHPNSLLDPVMIIAHATRRISFAAKDTLFEYFPLRLIFTALGAVPIRRKQDHQNKTALDNSSAFDALYQVLQKNGCMGIFPEGISHISSELAPLKTGAARIALGVYKNLAPGQSLTIIPSGLTYKSRRRMRTSALVQFGAPITIDASWQQKFMRDEKATTQELTAVIDARLRALTINAPDFETLRVLSTARRIYQPENNTLSIEEHNLIMRRFVDHYERFKDEPHVRKIFSDLGAFQYEMDMAGITDHQLLHTQKHSRLWRKLFRHLILCFCYLPLALPGFILHFPILALAVFTGEGLSPRKDVIATTKMMSATFLVLLAYLLLPCIPLVFWPWPLGLYTALYLFVFLPTTGWSTVRVLERQAFFRRGLGVWFKLLKNKELLRYLQSERRRLQKAVQDLVDQYVDPALPRVVPKSEI
jgi:glycerol-3-phosphate O-acyltransferase / dihydroxyacetone phosphate acyltransferase